VPKSSFAVVEWSELIRSAGYDGEVSLLERVLATAPVAFQVYGADGHCVLVNRAFQKLFGAVPPPEYNVLRDEVVRKNGYLELIHRAFSGATVSVPPIWYDASQNGQVEARGAKRVGVAATFFPLTDRRGHITHVAAVFENLTGTMMQREAAEAARLEAEAASRAKDEFLAMLGHELRNPLAPIATAVQLLRGDCKAGRELEVIERQVKHLTRLVDDLLDVSRITRGKIQLKRSRVEAARIVENAVEMASPLLEQRRHRLTINVPRDGLPLLADDARLAQVVANLVTNAAKYTEPGGSITLSAASEDGLVVIRVRDDGRGIAPEMLSRVFELFVQGQRSPDRAEGGLGLGLALVRSLVELHGGSVEARSEGVGRGSEFIVRLPPAAARSEAVPAEPAPRAAAEGNPAKRVLVVDDNQDAAELLGEVLRTAGHEVQIAHDGPEALGLLRRFLPQVAVLDIGLPVMDGYELARRLRAAPRLARLRCIAVTGYGQETDRARSRDAGFELHLVKPVDLSTLLQALEQ
jgi:signal transduction histidine kinase